MFLCFKTHLLKQSNKKLKYFQDQIISMTIEGFIKLKDNEYAMKQLKH